MISMGNRITSVRELQNIVALDLDIWVAPPIRRDHNTFLDHAWCLKQPALKTGPYGLMLGSGLISYDYLRMWGINDPRCTAIMLIYDGNESRLYNTQQDAQNAYNRRLSDVLTSKRLDFQPC